MANVVLIVTVVLFAILVLFCAFYFLIYFEHPDDRWTSWFPRSVVILSVAMACYNVLLLPLDAANQNGAYTATGGLPMQQIETAFFMTTCVLAWAIIPFTMLYYEGLSMREAGEPGEKKGSSQLLFAIKWTVPFIIVAVLAILLSFLFIGDAIIQVEVQSGVAIVGAIDASASSYCNSTQNCFATNVNTNVPVDPVIFSIAMTAFVGWILFLLFGSFGMVTMPLELIMEYLDRPSHISKSEFERGKIVIGEMAQRLIDDKQRMEEENYRAVRSSESARDSARDFLRQQARRRRFVKDVKNLDDVYRELKEAFYVNSVNAVWVLFKFIFGILGACISFLWFLHICLYMTPNIFGSTPPTYFLNDMVASVSPIPFIGPSIYGLFVFYLLLATIRGAASLGARFPFIAIHPIVFGETLTSSLLFNVGIIMFVSLAVVQFNAFAFQDYARYTAVLTIMGTQIQYLQYIGVVYRYYPLALLVCMILSVVYVGFRPRLVDEKLNETRQRLEKLLKRGTNNKKNTE